MTICKVATPVSDASWAADDTVVFATGPGRGAAVSEAGTGLIRVSANGGASEVRTTPDTGQPGTSDQFPSVLPGGRGVLFTIVTERRESPRIAALDFRSGKWRVLLEGGTGGEYVDTGHLLYVSGNTLHAVPFDLDRLEFTGNAVPLVEDVAVGRAGAGAPQYALSRTGTLVYARASAAQHPLASFVWVDRGGAEASIAGAPERRYRSPRLSPNNDRLAVDVREGQNDTWVFDFQRRTFDKITSSPRNDDFPVWTPDGQKIVTGANPGLVWRPADGSGAGEALTKPTGRHLPMSFTPDGRNLVLVDQQVSELDLSVLTLNGSREVRALTELNTPADEASAEISPDGRWIAYQSNEDGQFKIYVRPFPDVGRARHAVSPQGGVTLRGRAMAANSFT